MKNIVFALVSVFVATFSTDAMGQFQLGPPAAKPTVTVDGGALYIIGTNKDDQVFINYQFGMVVVTTQTPITSSNGLWGINQPLMTSETKFFRYYEFSEIVCLLRGGNDRYVNNTWKSESFVSGDGGNDWLEGGFGESFLAGGSGNDVLFGGFGDDILSGDEGSDWLIGQQGQDDIWGGLEWYPEDGSYQNDDDVDFFEWVSGEDLFRVIGPQDEEASAEDIESLNWADWSGILPGPIQFGF